MATARATPPLPRAPDDPWARIAVGMWLHATQPRPDVGVTPHTIVHAQDKLVVRHYPPAGGKPAQPHPIVLVPSLINRAYILDLEEGRSLVGCCFSLVSFL